MANAELITALRYCGNFEDREGCDAKCPYIDDLYCPQRIMLDAAAALEMAEQRIAELMPKEGEWIPFNWTYDSILKCSNCGELACCCGDYCPNCGAKMKTVTNCHTLEEGEQHGES